MLVLGLLACLQDAVVEKIDERFGSRVGRNKENKLVKKEGAVPKVGGINYGDGRNKIEVS